MEDKIETFCEDCKVKLLTKTDYNRCFNKNHNIRVIGQFELVDPSAKYNPNDIFGIAKEDAKKGELFELEII